MTRVPSLRDHLGELRQGIKEGETACSHDDCLSAQGSETVREFLEDMWTERVGGE